ncbi:aldo/keto reductase [Singulisphaera sp. PoT]|uniref:aldo/keto reductase n=1 Tax=Singulisphaera sp. PoT TaxID=3411797 RepID=UPI003BF5C16E
MQTRQFGNTGMKITPIGFGSWAIGGGNWEFGWGEQDDRQAIEAIRRAVELGMNWVDTAAIYGLGHSEELVGRAIEGLEQKPLIFTKCSMLWDDKRQIHRSLKGASVRKECEDSLKRLGVDAIDLYQIHWPNPEAEIEEGWEALARLREEGKVRHIGVSNFSVAQMRRVQAIAPISSLQPPYSLLNRGIEAEILPYCLENNIGVIVYSPMASGMLTGAMTRDRVANFAQDDWRRRNPEYQEPRLTRNLELADLLGRIGERHGRSAGEVAIAWTLRHPAVTAAIVGGRDAQQVEGIIAAGEFRLSDEEAVEIESFSARAKAAV